MWPWGACWLQDEACQGIVEAAHKKPLMCGLGGGLPSQRFKGFKVFKGLERLERLEGLEGLRAGKRQAWTPIRSH